MVDRASLEILGFILGGVTAVVITIAVFVVRNHVDANAHPSASVDTTATIAPSAPVVPVALSPQR